MFKVDSDIVLNFKIRTPKRSNSFTFPAGREAQSSRSMRCAHLRRHWKPCVAAAWPHAARAAGRADATHGRADACGSVHRTQATCANRVRRVRVTLQDRASTPPQRAPEWHLAVRPSAWDATSPAAALVPDSKGRHPATKIFRRYPQSGLTAPNGGIRSALSIGTVVRSSAVVVGQRSERGVP